MRHASRQDGARRKPRRIGFVFQEPTLFPHLTVRDNIRYGVGSQGRTLKSELKSEKIRLRLRLTGGRNCEVLGIGDLGDRYPLTLSGGEAQRVALARALAPNPRLLLLDEPFASLDAPPRVRLRREVRALLQTTGTPAILVTHDRTEALAMGDTVAVVIGGQVRQAGPVGEVFSRPADAEVAGARHRSGAARAGRGIVAAGVIEVSVGGVTLHVAEREPLAAGAQVYACVRAEDVTLERRAPGQASARNHLAARVVAIASEGPIDRVTLDCGFPLDAMITSRSREELGLAPGSQVTAAVKATSIHLVPRV